MSRDEGRRLRILETLPHRLAERLVEEARKLAGSPVGLYVVDLDGVVLRLMVGDPDLPAEIAIRNLVGPEVPAASGGELAGCVEAVLPGMGAVPMWLHGRAKAVLVVPGAAMPRLDDLAAEGGAALELAARYTDDFHAARRRMATSPAAELQEDLLPPRIGRVEGADIAGTILPAYEVGGDWFDYAQNADHLYFALGDAVGKGPRAAALSALSLSALRSARRSGKTLTQSAVAVDAAVDALGIDELFLTAVIARWDPSDATLEWVTCGHPPPLSVAPDGSITQLESPAATVPLGLLAERPTLAVDHCHLEPGTRIVLYSDGVTERRTADGELFGRSRLIDVIGRVSSRSAEDTVSTIAEAVQSATTDAIRDDASILVLAID